MQNFTILEKVGSGSYSTVYRARDNRNQHIVALKIMKFPYTKGKRLQDMELTALKKFKSNPCVISLL
jgi:serine/threonine protein kinase